MLTPGRKSRRSILTPSRTSFTRTASPAPVVEKPQIVCETSQYKLQTIPNQVHSVVRDVVKRRNVKISGLHGDLGYVAEGNRVIVWRIGGNKMFELLAPGPVFSVHITEGGGAVVVTARGDVVRWSKVDQTQRYGVQQKPSPEPPVDSVLLSTDNSTLLLLDAGHNVWKCDQKTITLVNPRGGISRRVSGLFWTAPEAQLGDAYKIVSCDDVIFIVGTTGLQRIHGSLVTWTCELKSLVSANCTSLKICDVVAYEGSLKCLVELEGALYLLTLSSRHTTLPCSVDSIIQLQADEIFEARMLLMTGSDLGLLYNASEAHILTMTSGVTVPVQLGDDLLCTSVCAGDFHLLCKVNDIIKLVVKDVKAAVSNLNMSAGEESDRKTIEKKFVGAFKCFMEFNETQEQARLQEILGTEDTITINQIISDTAVYLLQSAPAADPRWGGSDANLPVTIGLQIEERIRRLKGLLQFLVATGYYDNLVDEENVALRILQSVEKCLVAKVLCGSNCGLLRRAISEAAALFEVDNDSVSSEDIFFRNIDSIDSIFGVLASGQNTFLSNKRENEAVIQDLFLSIEVVQQSFDVVHSWRSQSEQLYHRALKQGVLLWADTDEIRTMLTGQVHIGLDTVLPEMDEQGRYQVLLVAASLTESVLKLYQDLLMRMPENDNRTTTLTTEFERRRQTLIQPFVDLKVYQIAFTLAEQFKYFTLLVQLCEDTHDMAKLRTFSATHPGFAEVAYNWYLAQGKQSRLLTANVADPQQLSQFLSSRPHLKWLHQLGAKDYSTAGESLVKLGKKEKSSLSRKKTLLSISKLSLLAAGEDPETDQMAVINRHLDTVTQQERMKPEIIENAGLFPDNMAPISSPDLIRLYVGDYNPQLEDLDIKKALDLLKTVAEDDTISNEEFEKLRLEIWVSVICRDEWWDKCFVASPQQIDETLFYRAVILAYNSGMLVSHVLPSVQELLSVDRFKDNFKDPTHFKQFEYILRSGFEQMSQRCTLNEGVYS